MKKFHGILGVSNKLLCEPYGFVQNRNLTGREEFVHEGGHNSQGLVDPAWLLVIGDFFALGSEVSCSYYLTGFEPYCLFFLVSQYSDV